MKTARWLNLFVLCAVFSESENLLAKDTSPETKVCMVLDKGGKDDHSFNESAVRGFQKALKELKISPKSKFVEPSSETIIPQFFNNFATTAECDLIIGVGFLPSTYIPALAAKYPEKKFLALDVDLESKNTKKNIRSVTFQEHEGSFLVGAIAAMKSSTGKVGFIGGMDVPLIHRFELGYEAGAKYVNPKIKITKAYVGITTTAWNNPSKAKELAIAQYSNGVDVIYQVAAASGNGVFDAAEDFNKSSKTKHYAIGVDSNQNWMKPNVILTSMIKKVDVAVFDTIQDVTKNKFTSGNVVFGFKDSGIEWAYDEYNKSYYTPADVKKINEIKQKIISGKIKVPDYYKNPQN